MNATVVGFNYTGLNLTNAQIEELMHRENSVVWHCSLTCAHCGDHMFWLDNLKRFFCRSWLYMEGGCTPAGGLK